MKVLKFGGTSVGSVESLVNVKKIVEAIPGKAIVVVSALGGLTDRLIAIATSASKGDDNWKSEIPEIRLRHFRIIDALVEEEKKDFLKEKINELIRELERNYEGVYLLKALPEKILDLIVSFGERMSSHIVAAMIKGGKRYYSPDFIKTTKWYGKNVADTKLTTELIQVVFENIGEDEKAIVPGFISTDVNTGDISNLGRGGSDYTGALIAAALDAEILEIWTDVDGFMTADPRIVKDALIIDRLSFSESMELCTFGAKVVYPPTIYPVFHKNIPIKILNTFNPKAPGTLITDQAPHPDTSDDIKGVSALKGVSLLSININRMADGDDYLRRALSTLSRQGVKIIPVANPFPQVEFNLAILSSDARGALKMLNEEFAPEIIDDMIQSPRLKENYAAIAVVGKELRGKSRLAARIGHSLRRGGINVEAYSAGNSDTTLIYIINQEKSSLALPLIHDLIF